MAWNFNSKPNEYNLFSRQSKEFIDKFGIEVEYFKIDNVGRNIVFNEFTYRKSNANDVYPIMVYPENTESFDNAGDMFSKFGLQFTDSINLIVSKEYMKTIYDVTDFKNIMQSVGDLIRVNRGKIFEVTGIEDEVAGLSNMFTESNAKNVYMLKCRIYNYNPRDVVEEIIPNDEYDFSNLTSVFNDIKTEQDTEAAKSTSNRDSVFGTLG
jgi:hypothetical protein